MIWYIASRLVLLCVLLGMLVCGFFMCMNLANVYIVLDEGLDVYKRQAMYRARCAGSRALNAASFHSCLLYTSRCV